MLRSKLFKSVYSPLSYKGQTRVLERYWPSQMYGIITENGIPDIDKALLASDLNSRIHLVKELQAGSCMVGTGEFKSFLNEAITSKGLQDVYRIRLPPKLIIDGTVSVINTVKDLLSDELKTDIFGVGGSYSVGGLIDWASSVSCSFPPAIHADRSYAYAHLRPGEVRPKVHLSVCEAGVRATNNFVDNDGFALDLWTHFIGSDAEIAIGVSEGNFKVLWRQKSSNDTIKVFQFPADNTMASIAEHGNLLIHTLAYGITLTHKFEPVYLYDIDIPNMIVNNPPITSGNTVIYSHRNLDSMSFTRISFRYKDDY